MLFCLINILQDKPHIKLMDETEFSHISQRLRGVALRASMHCGAAPMQAEDVAQDVLLRLWQMRDDLDEVRSLDAFVSVIARRLTLNLQNRKPESGLEGLQVPDRNNDPALSMEERENEEWLARRLEELPSSESAILQMRQVEHRSMQEIARLLGMTEHSVRTLLSSARRKLFEEYKRRYNL